MNKLSKLIITLAGVLSLALSATPGYAATALNGSSCQDTNVLVGLGMMETAFATKDLTTISNIVDTNYLNKAENKTAFLNKLSNGSTGLFDVASSVQVSYGSVVCSAKNVGTTAAPIAWEDVIAFETMTRTISGVTSTQVNYKHLIMKAVNGTDGSAGWTLYGNQKNWGVHFGTGSTNDPAVPASNGTWLYVHVDDPANLVTNVTISGPGITGSPSLYHDINGKGWDNWDSTNSTDVFPATTPTLPATYTLNIWEGSTQTALNKQLIYSATLNTNYPTSLSPNGDLTATPPVFNWADPLSGQYAYQTYLYDLNSGAQLWTSPNNIFGNSYSYNGAALASGSCYLYAVDALDINENIAETFGYLGINNATCLPTSLVGGVAPYAGSFSGTLSGSTTGAWAATVSPAGAISLTGYKTSTSGAGVISGTGKVFADGAFTIKAITGSTWNGTINPSTGLSGSWSNPNGNIGTFNGVAVNTAVADPLLGAWKGTVTDSANVVWNRMFNVYGDLTWSVSLVASDSSGKSCISRGSYSYNTNDLVVTVGSTVATGGASCGNPSGTVYTIPVNSISGSGVGSTVSLGVPVGMVSATSLTLLNPTGTHSASGTYTLTTATTTTPASITWNWLSSDIACAGPSLGISYGTQTFSGIGITPTTMIWPGSLTWTRASGLAGDITGTWSATNNTTGNSFTLIVDATTMNLSANIATCNAVNPPGIGTYAAFGTSTWNVIPNEFDFTITASNFVGDSGPGFGLNTISGVTVTATTMTWPKNGPNNGDLVWTCSGTCTGVTGTWTANGGNGTFTLTINADNTVNIIGTVTSPVDVSYGTNTDSNGYHNFNININDSLGAIQSAILSGGPQGTLGTGALVSNPNTGGSGLNWNVNWSNAATGTFNYTVFPNLPVTYTLTINYLNGAVTTQQISYTAFNTTFVTGLTPSGNYTLSTPPTFTWTVPAGMVSDGISLMSGYSTQNNSWSNNAWSNWNLNGANSAVYNASTPLPACSQVRVSAHDANNNQSTLIQYLGGIQPDGQSCGAKGVATTAGYTSSFGTDTLGGTWATTVKNSTMSIVVSETNGTVYSLTSQLTGNNTFITTAGSVTLSGAVNMATGAVTGTWTDSSTFPATSANFSGNIADTQAPTLPTNLAATVFSSTQINLSWSASTDNVGVTGYQVYRNGASTPVGFTSVTNFSDTGLTASTLYNYAVAACDAAGNCSQPTSPASATTSATGGTGSSTVNFNNMFIGRNIKSPGTAENFGVSLHFPLAAGNTLKSYSVTCPNATTVTGNFSAAANAAGSQWVNVANYNTQPATPFDCTSTVTYADNTTNTATATVDRFIAPTAYVTALSLAPNANVTSLSTVSWTAPAVGPTTGSYTYQGNLFGVLANGNLGSQLWFVGSLATSPITYNGPALVANTPYQFTVATIEGNGTNKIYAAQTFTPFCFQCTSVGVVAGAWATQTPMSTAHYSNSVAGMGGLLYAMGGNYNSCSAYSTLEAYDPVSNTWSSKPSMPTARWGLSSGVVGGILYAAGGTNGCLNPATGMNTFEAYDPVANTWTSKTPMNFARASFGVGVVNGKLYAVGGDNSSQPMNNVEAYDPVANSWTNMAPLQTARETHGVGVVNGILYAVGGSNGVSGALSSVEAYNPATNTWAYVAPLPVALSGVSVVEVNGILYVVGGNAAGAQIPTLLAYNPAADTWVTLPAMPTARQQVSSGKVKGVLYAVGGLAAGNSYLTTVEAYTPGTAFTIAGTATMENSIGAAFDGTNFLVGISDKPLPDANNTNQSITAQLVSKTGTLVGPRITTGAIGGGSLVAFDGTNYLLVYEEITTNTVAGQFVSTSGALVGSPFNIVTSPNRKLGIPRGLIFDGANYFVAWESDSTAGNSDSADIFGQFITPGGAKLGQVVSISTAAHGQRAPSLVFDGTNILAVWADGRNQSACYTDGTGKHCLESDIYGQFIAKSGVGAAGALSGANFLISSGTLPRDGSPVGIAFDGTNYLVTFSEEVSFPNACPVNGCNWENYGILVAKNGTPAGSRFILGNPTTSMKFFPSPSYLGSQYLVTWTDWGANSASVKGQYVTTSGAVSGAEFTLFAKGALGAVPWLGMVYSGGGVNLAVTDWGIPDPTDPSNMDLYTNADVTGTILASIGSTLNPLGTHTASGAYTWTPATGVITFTWTASDFVGCDGPSIGTKSQTGVTISGTTMIWTGNGFNWTQTSGTPDSIVGTWTGTDPKTGNVFTAIFNSNGAVSASAIIYNAGSCGNNGNQNLTANARSQHWSSGYYVQLEYSDSPKTATAVSVTGLGINGSEALTYNSGSGSWNSWTSPSTQVYFGANPPTIPAGGLPYVFTITPATGTATTANSTVSCFQPSFATGLSPTGSVAGTGNPTFSWTGIADATAIYGVELNDSLNNRVWSNYDISGTSIVYNGPALTPGATYQYNVVVNSSVACSNGASFAQGSFTYGGGSQAIGTISFTPATLSVNGTTTVSASRGLSGNPVTFTSTTTNICTVSGANGSTVTGLLAGNCTIAADQAGDGTYSAAPQVTQSITVTGGGGTGTGATLTFAQNWNLVGNSVEATLTVASAFGDPAKVNTVWKWIPSTSQWAFYAPSLSGGGQQYAQSKGYVFLTTINAGEGFWVNAKIQFNASLPSGAAVQSSSFMPAINLDAGGTHALPHNWSLIATGDSPSPAQFDAAIATAAAVPPSQQGNVYTSLTTLWAWDATHTNWYFWAPALVNTSSTALGTYITQKGYLDFSTIPSSQTGTLSPTTGFWVNMP